MNSRYLHIFACPHCKKPTLVYGGESIECTVCERSFGRAGGSPLLILEDSPVLDWFNIDENENASSSTPKDQLWKIFRWLKPEGRAWTRKSQRVIERLVQETNPDDPDRQVVLIGAGFESVFQRIFRPYTEVLRIGLAHIGDVDMFCDICDTPLIDESIDLFVSSSVLEHVYNPELAISEMYRCLKAGGYVYAEIPFLRSFHMAPIDYQRYTIAGIEEVFGRHGFTLVDKGICSGPFNALALFLVDFFGGLFSFNKYLRMSTVLTLSYLLFPLKYLDRFFENAKWAETSACNFYYVGKKVS